MKSILTEFSPLKRHPYVAFVQTSGTPEGFYVDLWHFVRALMMTGRVDMRHVLIDGAIEANGSGVFLPKMDILIRRGQLTGMSNPDDIPPSKPFETDGCSGGMSWIWKKLTGKETPWEGACIAHDRRYWWGGTKEDRKLADEYLRNEVISRGHPVIAGLMYYAVRVFGSRIFPTSWRFGYGRKYKSFGRTSYE